MASPRYDFYSRTASQELNMADALTSESIPEISPLFRFQWEEVQQCHVILYPEGMVKLSASAGEIMKRVDGNHSVGEIIAALQDQFGAADLGNDVYKFMEVAHENGWIRAK